MGIKFPPSWDGKGVKCPGYAGGGGGEADGILKLGFDRYINAIELTMASRKYVLIHH